jgi:AcrR family transcriptional regulator
MIDAAIELLQRRGTGGFTVEAVLAHSGAPRGSVYHHFPGGRDELLVAALRQSSGYLSHVIEKAAATGDLDRLLDSFTRFWRKALESSGHTAGCPVLAVAIDARSDLPEAAALVGEIFDLWRARIGDLLQRAGVPGGRSRRLATLVVAGVEGGIVLCRAERSCVPLDDVVGELRALLHDAVGT